MSRSVVRGVICSFAREVGNLWRRRSMACEPKGYESFHYPLPLFSLDLSNINTVTALVMFPCGSGWLSRNLKEPPSFMELLKDEKKQAELGSSTVDAKSSTSLKQAFDCIIGVDRILRNAA